MHSINTYVRLRCVGVNSVKKLGCYKMRRSIECNIVVHNKNPNNSESKCCVVKEQESRGIERADSEKIPASECLMLVLGSRHHGCDG